jgi:hypothetical protein
VGDCSALLSSAGAALWSRVGTHGLDVGAVSRLTAAVLVCLSAVLHTRAVHARTACEAVHHLQPPGTHKIWVDLL